MNKETVELVKKMIEDGNLSQEIAEKYCPELNEDEEIRKELINTINLAYDSGIKISIENRDKYLAWIEKQSEEKSIDMSMSIKEKSHQIAWETSKHYDPLLSKENWCEMAARDGADYVLGEIEKKLDEFTNFEDSIIVRRVIEQLKKATITEDYVSFEVAKLLKEKGFIENCLMRYNKVGDLVEESYKSNWNFQTIDYSAPTLQMAMKWLREIHLILYIIYPNLESGELRFSWRIYKLEQDKKRYVEELPGIGEYYKDSDESFTTYKEAEESLIKYCLENLI